MLTFSLMKHFGRTVVLGIYLNDFKIHSSGSRCKVLKTEAREML